MMSDTSSPVTELSPLPEALEQLGFILRGQRVMLSTHLAELYDVLPKALVQAVKRNSERFPEDFMFQLTDAEFSDLRSQFVTSSWGGLRRATPSVPSLRQRSPGRSAWASGRYPNDPNHLFS